MQNVTKSEEWEHELSDCGGSREDDRRFTLPRAWKRLSAIAPVSYIWWFQWLLLEWKEPPEAYKVTKSRLLTRKQLAACANEVAYLACETSCDLENLFPVYNST